MNLSKYSRLWRFEEYRRELNFMCVEKRGRNGCARNFQEFLNGGTFAGKQDMLPLHNKNIGR